MCEHIASQDLWRNDGPTEVPDQVRLCCIRRPFAIADVPVLMNIESILLVSFGELIQTPFGLVDLGDPLLSVAISCLQSIFEGRQPRIELNDACLGQMFALIDA